MSIKKTELYHAIIKEIKSLVKADQKAADRLAAIVNSILGYVMISADGTNDTPASMDVTPVNILVQGLSPANANLCRAFFSEFTPFRYSKDNDAFGKIRGFKGMSKDEVKAEKQRLAREFLSDATNDIWSWHKGGKEPQLPTMDKALKSVTSTVRRLVRDAEGDTPKLEDVLKAMEAALETGYREGLKQRQEKAEKAKAAEPVAAAKKAA